VKSKNKVLVTSDSKNTIEMIPFTTPSSGTNQRNNLMEFLKHEGLNLQVGDVPIMKRLILKNGRNIQRVNFVLFKGKIQRTTNATRWKSPKDDNLISALI
jgi:hypothetical protein